MPGHASIPEFECKYLTTISQKKTEMVTGVVKFSNTCIEFLGKDPLEGIDQYNERFLTDEQLRARHSNVDQRVRKRIGYNQVVNERKYLHKKKQLKVKLRLKGDQSEVFEFMTEKEFEAFKTLVDKKVNTWNKSLHEKKLIKLGKSNPLVLNLLKELSNEKVISIKEFCKIPHIKELMLTVDMEENEMLMSSDLSNSSVTKRIGKVNSIKALIDHISRTGQVTDRDKYQLFLRFPQLKTDYLKEVPQHYTESEFWDSKIKDIQVYINKSNQRVEKMLQRATIRADSNLSMSDDLSNISSLPKNDKSLLPNSGYGLGPSFLNAPARQMLDHYKRLKEVNLSNAQPRELAKDMDSSQLVFSDAQDAEKQAYLAEDADAHDHFDHLNIHDRQAYFESTQVIEKNPSIMEKHRQIDLNKHQVVQKMSQLMHALDDISFVVLPQEANRMFTHSEKQVQLCKRSDGGQTQHRAKHKEHTQGIQMINSLLKMGWHYLHALSRVKSALKRKKMDDQKRELALKSEDGYTRKVENVINMVNDKLTRMQHTFKDISMDPEKQRMHALSKTLETLTSKPLSMVRTAPDAQRDESMEDHRPVQVQFSL